MSLKLKIAIASGKGGTGKTFIATNLFNVLQKMGKQVNLVDCDAEEPNDREFISGDYMHSFDVTQKIPVVDESKCTYCGKCYDYCNYHAIFFLSEQRVIQVLDEHCHGCGACSVACEYGAITEKDDVLGTVTRYKVQQNTHLIETRIKVGVHSSVPVIKEGIKAAMDAELVLLDAPPGTSCAFIQTVAMADYVVLVTEPTPFGLSNLRQSVETLRSLGKPHGVIVNRIGLGNNEVFDYLKNENISLLMSVPFDRSIAKIYSNGQLLTNASDEWTMKFTQLFDNIFEKHGNSSY